MEKGEGKKNTGKEKERYGNDPGQAKKHEYGWDMLYPEEKDRYPRYRVIRVKKTKDDLKELNKLLKKINGHRHTRTRGRKKTRSHGPRPGRAPEDGQGPRN